MAEGMCESSETTQPGRAKPRQTFRKKRGVPAAPLNFGASYEALTAVVPALLSRVFILRTASVAEVMSPCRAKGRRACGKMCQGRSLSPGTGGGLSASGHPALLRQKPIGGAHTADLAPHAPEAGRPPPRSQHDGLCGQRSSWLVLTPPASELWWLLCS